MTRSLPWKELGENLCASEADKILEAFRSYTTYKSNTGICLRLGCASVSCKTPNSSNKCAWKGKVLICLVTERK
ncbi:hypothetical protein PHMEG_00014889 [Phytophthora megakarya]|uniref:Uncharacterized protein n=1 Tax=Phytophthora megakarya TaxID=4795 RepID=A0A225W2U2_9STRA|nr:hypothetical protein PHMEG_00014889 [Phytophthora megakarya]